MECISVKTENPYTVHVGRNILADCVKGLSKPSCRMALVADEQVFALYGERVKEVFEREGYSVDCLSFPAGEEHKNLKTFCMLLEALAKLGLDRTDGLIALGGGVSGDMTGFLSAVYLRGIDCIQIPTSFLAMVDASVGGKTAVDLEAGKNLAGAFHQPLTVFCDTAFLDSLPPERFREGAAESLKCAAIFDEPLFRRIEEGGLATEARDGILADCIRHKADVVSRDAFDRGERQLLNFGHTPAHAIERLSGYTVSHGEAVAMGMALITRAAEKRGLCETGTARRMEEALLRLSLPVHCAYTAKELAAAALSDKKRKGDCILLVTPKRIGHCVLTPLPLTELESFFQDGLKT